MARSTSGKCGSDRTNKTTHLSLLLRRLPLLALLFLVPHRLERRVVEISAFVRSFNVQVRPPRQLLAHVTRHLRHCTSALEIRLVNGFVDSQRPTFCTFDLRRALHFVAVRSARVRVAPLQHLAADGRGGGVQLDKHDLRRALLLVLRPCGKSAAPVESYAPNSIPDLGAEPGVSDSATTAPRSPPLALPPWSQVSRGTTAAPAPFVRVPALRHRRRRFWGGFRARVSHWVQARRYLRPGTQRGGAGGENQPPESRRGFSGREPHRAKKSLLRAICVGILASKRITYLYRPPQRPQNPSKKTDSQAP